MLIPINKFEVVKKGNEIAIVGEKKGLVIKITENPSIPAIIKVILRVAGFAIGCYVAVHNQWSRGVCVCPVCDAPTKDGPYGDWFCEYPECYTARVASWFGVD
ncbi:hypothetical protein M1N80_04330 [Peptococcaceae bacterium]|nr:hypothetical protein [Peptococcaceae bacterium]